MFYHYKLNKAKRKLAKSVVTMLSHGMTKEEIEKKAISLGWTKEIMEEIFLGIGLTNPELEKNIEKKDTGLKTKLDQINYNLEQIMGKDKIEEKLKKKKFKLPMGMKGKLKKVAKQGKVQVILLQRTKNIKPTIGEIKDGMLMVGDGIYDGGANYVWLWDGKTPTMIVPEWDLRPITKEGITYMRKPISSNELHDETVKNHTFADPQKIIIRAIEYKESQQPTKLSGKTLIWIIIGAGVLIGLFSMMKK